MKLLEERIVKDGVIGEGDVLKVNSFLNHQIDTEFISKLGEEFYRLYRDDGVNKIVTIEASGIGIACLTAQFFKCPVVFAKKSKTSNLNPDVFCASVASYTHGTVTDVIISKDFLGPADRVLIIDDFLAKGSALIALSSIVKESGATLVGAGIVIEKAYQDGGDRVRSMGIRVESLARIAAMDVRTGIRFID